MVVDVIQVSKSDLVCKAASYQVVKQTSDFNYILDNDSLPSTHPVLRTVIGCHATRPRELDSRVQYKNQTPSQFKNALRNVPLHHRIEDPDPIDEDGSSEHASSSKESYILVIIPNFYKWLFAPVLILAGLKYRGNIGTLVRAAVQNQVFREIILLDTHPERCVSPPDAHYYKWDQSHNPETVIPTKEIDYYSLANLCLIDHTRYATIDDVNHRIRRERHWRDQDVIGLDGGTLPSGEHSKSFVTHRIPSYSVGAVIFGAEDLGIPQSLLETCDTLLHIPCLSASINVSSAGSMMMAKLMIEEASYTEAAWLEFLNKKHLLG